MRASIVTTIDAKPRPHWPDGTLGFDGVVPEATGQPLPFVSRGRDAGRPECDSGCRPHRKAAQRAEAEDMCLTAWIAKQIEAA